MPVEALTGVVVDDRGAGVGMAGGDLYIAQRDSGLEGAHDERRTQHVRVHVADPGSLGGRTRL